MNQTFDLSRWMLLLQGHWAENRKRYLLSLLAIGGLLLGWYSFLLMVVRNGPLEDWLQSTTYFSGLYFVGCLYASSLFSELGNKAEGINYLSLPASHLEKLFCALFFGVFLFFVAYTLIFYIVDIPLVEIANRSKMEGHLLGFPDPRWTGFGVVNIFSKKIGTAPGIPIRLFMLGYFAIQSAFVLGSVWFTRYSFIKTIVTVLVFLLIQMLFQRLLETSVPHKWFIAGWFSWRRFMEDGTVHTVSLPDWIQNSLFFLMEYCLPFVFWTITYYRLKEKEV